MTAETQQVQHTPGPRRIGPHSSTLVVGANGRHVCTSGGYSTNTDAGEHIIENEANARLIAAAPTMFKYLKDLRDEVERADGGSHAVCAMLARRFWREWEATGEDA